MSEESAVDGARESALTVLTSIAEDATAPAATRVDAAMGVLTHTPDGYEWESRAEEIVQAVAEELRGRPELLTCAPEPEDVRPDVPPEDVPAPD